MKINDFIEAKPGEDLKFAAVTVAAAESGGLGWITQIHDKCTRIKWITGKAYWYYTADIEKCCQVTENKILKLLYKDSI